MMDLKEMTLLELNKHKVVLTVSSLQGKIDFYFKVQKLKDYIYIKHTSKYEQETGNKIALEVFSFVYGDVFLVVPIKTFTYALNRARDISRKKPTGVYLSKYPYMKLRLTPYSKFKYDIKILDKYNDEAKFLEAVNKDKVNRFGE